MTACYIEIWRRVGGGVGWQETTGESSLLLSLLTPCPLKSDAISCSVHGDKIHGISEFGAKAKSSFLLNVILCNTYMFILAYLGNPTQ